MIQSEFKYLSKQEAKTLVNCVQIQRHKLIVLLLLDAGLRVSEACTLVLRDFDFKKKVLHVRSLKKRAKKTARLVPISDRLYREIARFLDKKGDFSPESPLFPGNNGREFITRQSVNSFLKTYQKKANLPHFSPHALRHTFATHHLASGTKLEEIKTMLGHERFDTTLIYAKVPTETLQERVNAVSGIPVKKRRKWFKIGSKRSKTPVINLNFQASNFVIGRNKEIQKMNLNAEKGVNTLISGDIGTGKSAVLESLETSRRVLFLDDTDSIKKSLSGILLTLFQYDKNAVLRHLWADFEVDKIEKKIQRENTASLCQKIIEVTEPRAYIIKIDDITKITPSAKKVIEKLKDHFVIICAARYVKARDTSFLWNFERIELQNLRRRDAMLMINKLSHGQEVENWDVFRSHILNQTAGNPRAITEIIERYRKEAFITDDVVREVKHLGALQEIDMTWLVIAFLGVIMAFRYMAGELDAPGLKLVGGCAMIILLLMRPFLSKFKRKFL
jgi:hypothetical protein